MGVSPGQGLTTGLSPIPLHNQSAYHNTTIDVIRKGCFGDFNTVACIRNGVLAALGALTALLCAVRVVQLHVRRHPTCHQYLIFYCAAIEATLGAVHWVLGRYAQLDFILQYLKLMQFLVMCHFYCILATRVLRKEAISRRFLMPMLIGALSYFTVVVILAVIHVQGSWLECLQAYWIELSAAEFILVQLFMVAGFYITRRLNEISTLDSVRWQQKRDLWCIIIVFEFSAFAGVLYDLTLLILGDEQTGCSGIFLHIQELYSAVFVTFMVVKLLLPIWVMLSVFHPLPPASDQEDLLPAMSEDGTYTSIFSPTVEDQYYRQLYHPSEDYRSTEDAPAGGGRQVLAHRTPSLTPIKEESQPHTPSAASDYTHSPKAAFYL